jgi:hypothetical protein
VQNSRGVKLKTPSIQTFNARDHVLSQNATATTVLQKLEITTYMLDKIACGSEEG